ncbi:H/ACA ribonucleoprotein complex subunit 2-like protein [Cylas formicarius]|uniref:H/ACA ribonucleoprotein complex subunit 2-like protein n=1 Tax=Cylas formicarius TaxID=197179 RepID=UPI00295846AD|nr:H/ACA ribonucleoprotein complex subunit 2-like protein [Cylas formicarius]XP_060526775.1 H/ACA ribonucleoprotein complex subunit 2-like protein [Cylas formicarius]
MTKHETEETVPDAAMVISEELTYEQKVANCSIIAKPMASKKLAKKCYKLIKKASKHKTYVRCGLKDVQTRIRKGETGIIIFAGDVTPIDVMCHLPGVCEEKNIPYVYVPSRKDLGAALGVKRGCLTVLIRINPEYKEPFDELFEEINTLSVALN